MGTEKQADLHDSEIDGCGSLSELQPVLAAILRSWAMQDTSALLIVIQAATWFSCFSRASGCGAHGKCEARMEVSVGALRKRSIVI